MQSLNSDITVQKDGRIHVIEQINYDFGSLYKHGIYRFIPSITKNTKGKEYKMDIQVHSVKDETGSSYSFTTSHVNNAIQIKIGSANETITGEHTYVIDYTVSGALTYFSDHDELYWNVTGNEWKVMIEKVSSTIRLPDIISNSDVTAACYTGIKGETAHECTALPGRVTLLQTNTSLAPGSGLTIVVGFPKKNVAVLEPTLYTRFENTWYGMLLLSLLGIILVLLGFVWYVVLPIYIPIRWYLTGRDPKAQEVRVWYDPPKTAKGRSLTPAETGSLIDETVDMRDIFGSIVHLAQRGYLQIVEEKKNDFVLIKKKEWNKKADVMPFESFLLSGLFKNGDKLKIKGAELSSEMSKVTDSLYAQVVEDGFFKKNPQKTRTLYYVLGGIALVTGNIVLAIILFIFAKQMPAKTSEGAQQASVAKSLKTFLSSQERQLEFQAKNQMMFEKLLPFAIAFGVESIWANRFKDISLTQPSWYAGYNNSAFNAVYFASVMHSSSNSFKTSATPTSSSTGHSSGFSGGFSGGGGGGGGGGSW